MTQQLTTKDLGTILGIWAHPDDEIFSSAGVMAQAVQNGQRVACITATRGEQGVQDPERWPQHRLGQIRTEELNTAYKKLGIAEHHWLDYPDGGCQQVDAQQAIHRILELVDAYQPDTIMTFGPDGMTGHPDHRTVSAWATAIAQQRGIRLLYATLTPEMYEASREADEQFDMFFNLDQPQLIDEASCALLLKLEGSLLDTKCAALQAMPSQTAKLVEFFGYEKLCTMLQDEAFILG